MTHDTDQLNRPGIPGWAIMVLAIIAAALAARLAYLGVMGAATGIADAGARNPAHDMPENRVEWQDVDPDRSRPALDLGGDL